ncbi:MAG TPA: hypothetical protein VGJ48_17045 [Pyrinomonadaceae bacterium]|jgi:hypothetical protein
MRKTDNKSRSLGTLHVALAASLLLTSVAFTAAQDVSRPAGSAPIKMETKPTNCEFHIATLDAAHDQAGKDGLVIAIARLGDGKQRQDLNRRRLHNVRTYLVEFEHRSRQTIITAEGERVNGYGRVELYVGGKLFYVLMIRANADFAVGSCSYEGEDPCSHEREKKLYPCLGRNSRKQ